MMSLDLITNEVRVIVSPEAVSNSWSIDPKICTQLKTPSGIDMGNWLRHNSLETASVAFE